MPMLEKRPRISAILDAMSIRFAGVTAMCGVIAFAAVAVVVLTATPEEAGPRLILLLWAAIVLGAWGLGATVLLMMRQSIPRAIGVGLIPACSVVGFLLLVRQGWMSQRLLGAIVLATLVLSGIVWWRLRNRAPNV